MQRDIFIHGGDDDDYRIPRQLRQQQRRARRTNLTNLGLRNRCGGGDCSNSEAEAERVKSSAYVDFVNRVTTEILRKGIFTDRDGPSSSLNFKHIAPQNLIHPINA